MQDQSVRIRFYKEPTQNAAKSAFEGRPIFDDVEFVEVNYPGDKLSRLIRFANDPMDSAGKTYIDLYPDHYAAFKRGDQRAVTGTPLEHWPILTSSRVAELKASNIMSVDELAAISDSIIPSLGPGGRELREQARQFIERAKGGANSEAQAARIAALESQIKALQSGPKPEPKTVDINDATDGQLKQFIKDQTGEAPRGNINRDTLIDRVNALNKEAA